MPAHFDFCFSDGFCGDEAIHRSRAQPVLSTY